MIGSALTFPPGTPEGGPGLDVLVVDDSAASAQALAMALSMDGYRSRVVTSGREALEEIARRAPHCVLMDFGMDEIDGLELARKVRAAHGDDVVLIMITGWDTTQPRVAEAAALVDHHFVKPLDLNELRRILPPQEMQP